MTQTHRREPEQGEHLTCPNHGEETVRLVECEDQEDMVECLRCDYSCQNFLKFPVAEVTNTGGERFLKNVLTGEIVERLEPTAPWSMGGADAGQAEGEE